MEKESRLIWGAAEIAEIINRGVRATYHMLESGYLPARKAGELWVAKQDELRDLARWPKGESGVSNVDMQFAKLKGGTKANPVEHRSETVRGRSGHDDSPEAN